MKNLTISIYCAFILSVFSVQAAIQNEISDKEITEKSKKVSAKCYVTLVGGLEVITFWRVQPEKLAKLAKKIIGKRVSTHKSLEKIKIYRAYQCVLNENEFTSLKAKLLDEKTPR